jgi:hypothetical protein
MVESSQRPEPGETGTPVRVDRELILELNFEPEWARKPPTQAHFYAPERPERRPRGDERRGRGRERGMERAQERDRVARGKREVRRGAERERRRETRPAPGGAPAAAEARAPRQEPRQEPRVAPAPVQVRFLPEQARVGAVVRKIHATARAYPLMDVAALFLSNPAACYVRIELPGGNSAPAFYHCRLCGMAAMERQAIEAHVLAMHMADYFETRETETDPPSGAFTCVARCGLSGELLGPPNHHSTEDRMREVHRRRFPEMSFAAYRQRVETVHDPAQIEAWKAQSSRRIDYILKPGADAAPHAEGEAEPKSMTWPEAEAYMLREVVPGAVTACRRTAMPADQARRIADPALRETVHLAWRKESRFPLSLSSALRAAFRHRKLYVFKAGSGMTFVTSVRPVPLDTEHVVETLREVLLYLGAHPGCTRAELVAGLRAGADAASEEGRAVLAPLRWLIEKGHIIEFHNGCLSVPLREVPDSEPKAPPRRGRGKKRRAGGARRNAAPAAKAPAEQGAPAANEGHNATDKA